MEKWNGSFNGIRRGRVAFSNEDLQEDEVWAMMNAREGSNPTSKAKKSSFSSPSSSPSSSAWRFTAHPRNIPRSGGGGGNQDGQMRSSAPVDIPDWSKSLRRKANKNPWDDEYDDDDGGRSPRVSFGNVGSDDDDDQMVPPHEYLARRLAATQIASFSMCEGVGRTLKGRDLSKLRNAILTKTGFLE